MKGIRLILIASILLLVFVSYFFLLKRGGPEVTESISPQAPNMTKTETTGTETSRLQVSSTTGTEASRTPNMTKTEVTVTETSISPPKIAREKLARFVYLLECNKAVKLRDGIYSYCFPYQPCYKNCAGNSSCVWLCRQEYSEPFPCVSVIIKFDDRLNPVYYRREEHVCAFGIHKFNESSFLSLHFYSGEGHLTLYDHELNKVWRSVGEHGGFTDLEVVNNSIYAIDGHRYGRGEYYLDEISGEGKVVRSVKVVGEGEFVELLPGDTESSIEELLAGLSFPKLEYVNGAFYVIWYDKRGNCTNLKRGGRDYTACHENVIISKVDREGRRIFNVSLPIGPYRIDWLNVTHVGDSLVLTNTGFCKVIYLHEDMPGAFTATHLELLPHLNISKEAACFFDVVGYENATYVRGEALVTPDKGYAFLIKIDERGVEVLQKAGITNVRVTRNCERFVTIKGILPSDGQFYVTGFACNSKLSEFGDCIVAYVAKLSDLREDLGSVLEQATEVGPEEVVQLSKIPKRG
ncbi:MAG: hypothetical protein QXL56_01445 [Candidatus Korarchaeum sp.]